MTNTTSKYGIQMTVAELLNSNARKATLYIDEKTVITAARRHRPHKRDRYVEVLLKLGQPNFRERLFIKASKKDGEPFPVKEIQLKFWPK